MLILFATILNLCIMPTELPQASVLLTIENIREVKGVVRVALFNQEAGFPQEEAIYKSWVVEVNSTQDLVLPIPDLTPGWYALAVYHDLDNNGKMAKNLWGIPQEPFGFSRNQPAKWRVTRFDEASFTLEDEEPLSIRINLSYWDEL